MSIKISAYQKQCLKRYVQIYQINVEVINQKETRLYTILLINPIGSRPSHFWTLVQGVAFAATFGRFTEY